MILGLRRKVNIKVRQPLSKIMVPVIDEKFEEQLRAVSPLILAEVNVKDIEFLKDTANILVKSIKPNFKTLGPRYGKMMKQLVAEIGKMEQDEIAEFESSGSYSIEVDGKTVELNSVDMEIISEDIPGWLVANEGKLTVALDITVTDKLRQEGIAREFVNRIQNLRKEIGLEVTDKIKVRITKHPEIDDAVNKFKSYIGTQTLANSVELVETIPENTAIQVVIEDKISTNIQVEKI
jgi:isoleucyl-tRNA synthetase